FNTILKCTSLNYCRCLQPDEIVDVLSTYDCLLLPTHYYTEGFPGSILDAYRSGIPVIVSKWKYAHEFVSEGKTGFIADFNNPLPDIVSAINKLLSDHQLLNEMKNNAYKEATKYTEDVAWKIISKYL
ncbi:MAG: glycosyltransferase, partial [Muribaculaceae bacterium]|nr:glycosyltransferase [Muribaculaceae bacterium]